VALVPAPFTPTSVDIQYSATENLTRVRWQLARDNDQLRFDLEVGNDSVPIDFAAAPFAAGRYPCGDGETCFQWTRRGTVPPGARLVATHVQYGRFRGAAAQPATTDNPVTFAVRLDDDNHGLTAQIRDWLETPGPHRSFDLTLWPSDDPTCATVAGAPVSTISSTQHVPFSPDSVAGTYCAAVRPIPSDGGAQATFRSAFITNPDIANVLVQYTPPSETTPIVWRLMTDLEIISPDRCQSVHDQLEQAFRNVIAQTNAEQAELPSLELSPNCSQAPMRSFSAPSLADNTKQYLASHYTNVFQRPILFYLDNLVAPMPAALSNSFNLYLASFPSDNVKPILVALASDTGNTQFTATLPFVDPEDPHFLAGLTDLVQSRLPLKSQLHDSTARIPLLSSADLGANLGALWKVCDASPAIVRFTGAFRVPDTQITAVVSQTAPPAFTVDLPPKILVASRDFRSDTVIIRNQLCRRWCDHAFADSGGLVRQNWLKVQTCQRAF
jgi:hypothetical protein